MNEYSYIYETTSSEAITNIFDDGSGGNVTLFDESLEVPSLPHGLRALLIVLIAMVCVFGAIGNLTVAVAIASFPNLRTITNFLIISLTVADTAVCAWVMPIAAYQDLNGGLWYLGDILCDIWAATDVFFSNASIYNLCAVSIDRYLAVSIPIWYATKRKPIFALLLIVPAWVISFTVSILTRIIVGGFAGNENIGFCTVNTTPTFGIIGCFISFYIPACFILVLYSLIIRAMSRMSKKVKPSGLTTEMSNATGQVSKLISSESRKLTLKPSKPAELESELSNQANTDVNEQESEQGGLAAASRQNEDMPPPIENNDEATTKPPIKVVFDEAAKRKNEGDPNTTRRKVQKGKERKTFKREKRVSLVIGVVVLAFIISWLPFFTVYLMISFCPTCVVSLKVFQFVTWLGWSNSVLNPLIYVTFNREFRMAFLKMYQRLRR